MTWNGCNENDKNCTDYKQLFVTTNNITRGVEFWNDNKNSKVKLLNDPINMFFDLLKINTQINMSSLNVLNFIENYKENRKFDINHLKALKAKKYVEKITV